MDTSLLHSRKAFPIDVALMADFIVGLQKASGEIPWSEGGKTDPWDHIESAMGLSAAGYYREAERAYGWLCSTQLPDGSWWSASRAGAPVDRTKESNFASYIAVGVYHHFLITGDIAFLRRHWPAIKAGVNYAVELQAHSGEIHWARNSEGIVDPMALLTGSCSVYMSLKCAIAVAERLGKGASAWKAALHRLGDAIRYRPSLFNMMKSRFSMDWYYPVLCGAITGDEARKRIERSWDKFVVPGWGVRCVSDQPWVTTAEASELVLALMAIGDRERAAIVFGWICDKCYDDGSYWMGVTFPDGVIWPEEKTSWTTAAVLLAHDALYAVTPANRLFSHRFWERNGIALRGTRSPSRYTYDFDNPPSLPIY
ncbi:MAG: phenyltransferase domain-containing protein [Deltaproteobacteria bacterium]|nr:phenyltransferase domain-containing protein [Deltaproteobacteria bacterium]